MSARLRLALIAAAALACASCTTLAHDARTGDLVTVQNKVGMGGDANEVEPKLMPAVTSYDAKPLHWAALNGYTEIVRFLLAHGASASSVDSINGTPLAWAALGGHVDAAGLLVKAGADVNAADSFGDTPLHRASDMGRLDMVKLLLASGSNPDARDVYLQSPADLACAEWDGGAPCPKAEILASLRNTLAAPRSAAPAGSAAPSTGAGAAPWWK